MNGFSDWDVIVKATNIRSVWHPTYET